MEDSSQRQDLPYRNPTKDLFRSSLNPKRQEKKDNTKDKPGKRPEQTLGKKGFPVGQQTRSTLSCQTNANENVLLRPTHPEKPEQERVTVTGPAGSVDGCGHFVKHFGSIC